MEKAEIQHKVLEEMQRLQAVAAVAVAVEDIFRDKEY